MSEIINKVVSHFSEHHIDVGLPTLDRPFGIYLWDVFTVFCVKSFGWDPTQFEFTSNEGLPFTTLNEVIIAIVTYYVVIFGGRALLKAVNAPVIKINFIFQIHNLFLTILSLTLFLLLVEQLVPIVVRHGILYAICNTGSWTQPIVTIYYLNYLTKYYELFDTVFLVLRKKDLTFLHTYHHGATALLCYTQLLGRTSVSWVPIVLNLFVHVIMYWYYFLAACKIRVWWKEWVTRTQIIQFIIDLNFVYFASYTYFTSTYWPHLPNMGNCAGEEFAAIYGCAILSSYLVLFISFYIRVYTQKGGSKKTASTKEKVAEQVGNAELAAAETTGRITRSAAARSRKA
ncbi:fatty acid elongase ELO2 [Sugiyamaella lignohabitans]|uniref:Elongation of fatty acids protein n=1 Tax=Sugiyamaella lignohabitans TaxID=796027 RepID=A0A161HL75_9ASCO|nr:fatty acid elongase ELO2 [Sugiyamaella lignohabitans]ANB12748.1 fatty acid elongase ELO2 [Sugiyamaella lignohabitans]